MNLTGLLIGAGASYEAGMPLAWDITKELKNWLTPEKLRSFNETWRAEGGGYPDEVIDSLVKVLIRPEQHYESILGYLEAQYRRSSALQQEYNGLYSWLVEATYQILYLRHVNNIPKIERRLHFFEGLARLTDQHKPLWIFSLNHDVIIECLAEKYKIPINNGFTNEHISLPLRNKSGVKTGTLNAETISDEKFENAGLSFWQPGIRGVNLLKIHGALDVFTFKDGKDILKLLPIESSVAGVIGALKAANEELLCIHPEQPRKPLRVINEIIYADDTEEIQFLRRTLLAGAFKFDVRRSQVLPQRFLLYFKSYINYLSNLICIGYSFCDIHINLVIREWLEFSADRTLEIVDPFIKNIPTSLLHLAPQITLTNLTTTEYLDRAAGIVRTKRDVLEKKLMAWAQSQGRDGQKEFQEYLKQDWENRLKIIVEKAKTLPTRDGDIDIEALGVSAEELARQWFGEPSTIVEDVLEKFLESRKL